MPSHPWRLPVRSICRYSCTGGIYAAPTSQPILFIIIYGRGRGMPRPYRAVVFYCPVGRGDPPRRGVLQSPQISPSSVTCGDSFPQGGGAIMRFTRWVVTNVKRRGQDPSLRITGCQAVIGKAPISGRFVGDAYMRPVAFTRQVSFSVWLQRAAYMPPLQTNPVFSRRHLTAGGACPAPTAP